MIRNTTAQRVYPPNAPYIMTSPLSSRYASIYDSGLVARSGIRPMTTRTIFSCPELFTAQNCDKIPLPVFISKYSEL